MKWFIEAGKGTIACLSAMIKFNGRDYMKRLSPAQASLNSHVTVLSTYLSYCTMKLEA